LQGYRDWEVQGCAAPRVTALMQAGQAPLKFEAGIKLRGNGDAGPITLPK